MDIENIKIAKFKKYILNISMIFAIMVILPGFISSLATKVNAYEFKSISGKTHYKVTSELAKVYNYLVNKMDNDFKDGYLSGDTLKTKLKNSNIFIGEKLDYSSDGQSFLRNSCIKDLGGENTACNINCYEYGKSSFDWNNGGVYEVNQILYITPEGIDFWKLNDDGADPHKHCNIPNGFNYQRFLAYGYKAQSNFGIANDFAEYLANTTSWRKVTSKALTGNNENYIEYWKCNNYGDYKNLKDFKKDTKGYQYSGLFIFYSAGGSQGQGRMAYHVVRQKSNTTPPSPSGDIPSLPDLQILKEDFDGNSISSGVTFGVYLNNISEFTINKQPFSLEALKKSRKKDVWIEDSEGNIELRDGYAAWGCNGEFPGKPIRDNNYYYGFNGKNHYISLPNGNGLDWNRVYIHDVEPGEVITGITALENEEVIIDIYEETCRLNGYVPISKPLRLTYIFDKDEGEWELQTRSKEHSGGGNELPSKYFDIDNPKKIIIKDDYKIDNLNLAKYAYDSNGTRLPIDGATFKVTFNNVRSIGGYSGGNVCIGNLNFTNVVYDDPARPITVQIEEISAPVGYKKITGTIKFEIYRNGNTYSFKDLTEYCNKTNQNEVINGKVDYHKEFTGNNSWCLSSSGHTVNVRIVNVPIVNIGGIVWQDGQIGVKDIAAPNGLYDNGEEGIVRVKVELYKVGGDGTPITKDAYGNELMTTTASAGKTLSYPLCTGGQGTVSLSKGQYVFPNLEKGEYYVKFLYDGINYQTTKYNQRDDRLGDQDQEKLDSDVQEINRDTFNGNFKTISKEQSNNGTQLKYNYYDKYGYYNNNNNGKFILNAEMDGTNPANNYAADFQMTANSDPNIVYGKLWEDRKKEYWNNGDGTINPDSWAQNIDCGLVNKEFDLAIGTDVKSARLKINEKETTYNYSQIMNGEMEDDLLDGRLQNKSSDQNVTYNLYLYESDYRYRISDYKTENRGGINNSVNTEDDKIVDYEGLKKLEAYVTYSVILKGQTTQSSTVDEFVYYYDEIYTPYNIESTDEYDVIKDTTNRKITFKSKGDGFKITSPDYRVEIDLEFRVKENSDGYIQIKGDCSNVVEITKYSTDEGGLIDKDSAPGNADITVQNGTPKTNHYEDDTDQAAGLNITKKEESRTITGTVFEDKDEEKDGIKNNNDTPVDDVIVQLIEIKKISNKYYEYIWQETRSGSDEVKTTERNGYVGKGYTNSVTEGSGQYEFKDYIPGNYIIRYIYGDGTVYDVTDNVKKYNGQDYKSTIDKSYKEQWYKTSNYTSGQSVARDNEARRLEVMAYSATIDKEIGKALDEKMALDKTWMCAETSRINVPIEADNKETAENSTNVSYNNIKPKNIFEFDYMNFGLELRPQTKLVLEKHITGLKITPNGTGVQSIVDAKANIDNIINGDKVSTEGVTEGLATTKSTVGNRGFWEVATDIEELAQGAQLEVEYTYVIRNDGDKDYLSKTLVDEYKKQDESPYNESLTDIRDTVKESMKNGTYSYTGTLAIGNYLGQYYYTGIKGNNDAEVPTRIEANGLEEALNNDLKFDSNNGTSGEDFKKTSGLEEKTVYTTNGETKPETIETIVQNTKASEFLTPKTGNTYTKDSTVDYNKTITLRTVLSASSGGELGTNLPSYIAEVIKYSNAAGRRDMEAEPENLSYVHSDDTEMTMSNSNERDEFWGETVIITKPTGEDKITPMQIAIITVTATAVLGVGIILIKKYVLKK